MHPVYLKARARMSGGTARVLLALVGVLIFSALVYGMGWRDIETALKRAFWAVPVVALLEVLRVSLEAASARSVVFELSGAEKSPGFPAFARAQFIAHAVMNLLPGGRVSAEAVKGALFARELGVAHVVVTGATNQAVVMMVLGFATLVSASVAWVQGHRQMALAFVMHSLFACGGGIGIRVLQTSSRAARHVGKVPLMRHLVQDVASLKAPFFPGRAFAWMTVARSVQFVELTVLVYALQSARAFNPLHVIMDGCFAEGLTLAGAVTGAVIPGQAGTAEAVFAGGAEFMGMRPSEGLALGVLLRIGQSLVIVLGLVTLLRWRSAQPNAQNRSAQEAPGPVGVQANEGELDSRS